MTESLILRRNRVLNPHRPEEDQPAKNSVEILQPIIIQVGHIVRTRPESPEISFYPLAWMLIVLLSLAASR